MELLHRCSEAQLRAALRHVPEAGGGATQQQQQQLQREQLAAKLMQAPIRDVRAALGRLGVGSCTGCVERSELLGKLVEAAAAAEAEEEPWPAGTSVRLANLNYAPMLNTQRATILGYDAATERYEVRLEIDGSLKRVREENFFVEQEIQANKPNLCTPEITSTVSVGTAAVQRQSLQVGRVEAKDCEQSFHIEREGSDGEQPLQQAAQINDNSEQRPVQLHNESGKVDGCVLQSVHPAENVKNDTGVALLIDIDESMADYHSADRTGALEKVSPSTEAAISRCQQPQEPQVRTVPAPATGQQVATPIATAAVEMQAFMMLQNSSEAGAKQPMRLRTNVAPGPWASGSGRLTSGLQSVYAARELCDMHLICRKAVFPAHRIVLVGQSSVLRARLQQTTELQLDDVVSQPDAVQVLLDFLYEVVGDFSVYMPRSFEVNADVLRLAHDLELPVLKRWATVFMSRRVTTRNFVECLALCEACGLPDVREKILAQTAGSSRAVAEVTADSALASRPQLLQELLKRVATPEQQGSSKRVRC